MPLTTTAKVKVMTPLWDCRDFVLLFFLNWHFIILCFQPKKLGFTQFSPLRKRKQDDSLDYICPIDTGAPVVNGTSSPPSAALKGLSSTLNRQAEKQEEAGTGVQTGCAPWSPALLTGTSHHWRFSDPRGVIKGGLMCSYPDAAERFASVVMRWMVAVWKLLSAFLIRDLNQRILFNILYLNPQLGHWWPCIFDSGKVGRHQPYDPSLLLSLWLEKEFCWINKVNVAYNCLRSAN